MDHIAWVNNTFGDMDLFLMDLILKGEVPGQATVLDIGCGEGRNGIYFVTQGYPYTGIDKDASKVKLIEYLSLPYGNASFHDVDFMDFEAPNQYDLILCSRVLHFLQDHKEVLAFWQRMKSTLSDGGILYASMDSVVDNSAYEPLESDQVEFPDGAIRCALTHELYQQLKSGMKEVYPLRTLSHKAQRTQSFLVLQKI